MYFDALVDDHDDDDDVVRYESRYGMMWEFIVWSVPHQEEKLHREKNCERETSFKLSSGEERERRERQRKKTFHLKKREREREMERENLLHFRRNIE